MNREPGLILLVWMLGASLALGQDALIVPAQPPQLAETCEQPFDPLCWHLSRRDPYSYGMWDVQFLTGFDPRVGNGQGSKANALPQVLRLGTMFTTPHLPTGCFFRGNWEALVEVSADPLIGNASGTLVGGAGLLRYNFVQPWCLAVPYAQFGLGGVYADSEISGDRPALFEKSGQLFVRSDVGVRLFISEQVTIDAEAGYRRIGFGRDTSDGVGFLLGVTWFLGKH